MSTLTKLQFKLSVLIRDRYTLIEEQERLNAKIQQISERISVTAEEVYALCQHEWAREPINSLGERTDFYCTKCYLLKK